MYSFCVSGAAELRVLRGWSDRGDEPHGCDEREDGIEEQGKVAVTGDAPEKSGQQAGGDERQSFHGAEQSKSAAASSGGDEIGDKRLGDAFGGAEEQSVNRKQNPSRRNLFI